MKNNIPVLGNIPQTSGVEPSPEVSLLADTLLRRGFPVRIEQRGLAMCQTVNRWDVAFMRRALSSLNPAAGSMEDFEPYPDDRIPWRPAKKLETQEGLLSIWGGKRLVMQVDLSDGQGLHELRSQILQRKACRYETGPPRSHDMGDCKDWEGFLRNRYGAMVTVKELERGLALLVKVLPWLGVCTSMSCHGHGLKGNPKIWFYGHYHSQWCEAIFTRLFGDLEIARMWRFRHGLKEGSDWASARCEIFIPEARQLLYLDNPSEGEIIHLYRGMEEGFARIDDQIQIMARRLFNPALCERIREVRQQASGVKDFSSLLDKALPAAAGSCDS